MNLSAVYKGRSYVHSALTKEMLIEISCSMTFVFGSIQAKYFSGAFSCKICPVIKQILNRYLGTYLLSYSSIFLLNV